MTATAKKTNKSAALAVAANSAARGEDTAAQIGEAVANKISAALGDALERQAAAPAPELTDLKGVARMLHISYDTAAELNKTGRLPCSIKIGKSRKWRIAELQAWLAAGAPGRQKWQALKNN